MSFRSSVRACLGAFLALLAAGSLAEERSIRAHRTTDAIEIDGRFNEASWAAAEGIEDFTQQEPNEGQPLSERTRVRVMYDDENLYVGFECWDSQPDRIVANEMRRDGALWQNDNVYITLDTYGAKREGYFFRTNPLGAQEDVAIAKDGDDLNGNWDCIWETGAYIHDEGWNVELAIPRGSGDELGDQLRAQHLPPERRRAVGAGTAQRVSHGHAPSDIHGAARWHQWGSRDHRTST